MVCLSVGRSTGLSHALLSTAKTADPIELPFEVWTWVGPRNHVLDASPDIPYDGAILRAKTLSARQVHGWLIEQDQQFFYNEKRALEKLRTKCISVAESMLKSDKILYTYLVVSYVSLRTF